jgi:hypothetical protein
MMEPEAWGRTHGKKSGTSGKCCEIVEVLELAFKEQDQDGWGHFLKKFSAIWKTNSAA